MDEIRQAKDERVREMRCAVELMAGRLDTNMKNKLLSLAGQKRALSLEVEMIEGVLGDVEHQLRVHERSRLLAAVPNLLHSLGAIHTNSTVANTLQLPVCAQFVSEMVPPYEQQVFVMQPYSELRAQSHPLYSPALVINGLTWRLKVYPNGNGAVRNNYMSVFIELSQGPPEAMCFEYRVVLVHQTSGDANRNVVREFANEFDVGECWGYNRFYKISALADEGFVDMSNDSLMLQFHVRSPNYYQKCKELTWYTSQLEQSQQERSGMVSALRARLSDQREAAPGAPTNLHSNVNALPSDDGGLSSEADELSSLMSRCNSLTVDPNRQMCRVSAAGTTMIGPTQTSTNQHTFTVEKDIDAEIRSQQEQQAHQSLVNLPSSQVAEPNVVTVAVCRAQTQDTTNTVTQTRTTVPLPHSVTHTQQYSYTPHEHQAAQRERQNAVDELDDARLLLGEDSHSHDTLHRIRQAFRHNDYHAYDVHNNSMCSASVLVGAEIGGVSASGHGHLCSTTGHQDDANQSECCVGVNVQDLHTFTHTPCALRCSRHLPGLGTATATATNACVVQPNTNTHRHSTPARRAYSASVEVGARLSGNVPNEDTNTTQHPIINTPLTESPL